MVGEASHNTSHSIRSQTQAHMYAITQLRALVAPQVIMDKIFITRYEIYVLIDLGPPTLLYPMD